MYRVNNHHDFWTGPIPSPGPWVDDTTCSVFDRFFEVLRTDIQTHVNNINTMNLRLASNAIALSIKEWPGKGNTYLASTQSIEIHESLAPFQDINNNGVYDPENGDYPIIKGDQCIFWVINDAGGYYGSSSNGASGYSLGVEIHCMAYAYSTNNAINDATFYDYKIIKKTPGALNEFYFSYNSDPDIGDASDDYIGCNTNLDYAFACNGEDYDDEYGYNPPILVSKLKASQGMSSFSYYNNCINPQCQPSLPQDFRNYQLGLWLDGSAHTEGGNGYGGTIPTKYIYPGNPGNPAEWSECSEGNFSGDRRFVLSTGPYTLFQNTPLEFTLALMVVPTDSPYNRCPDYSIIIDPTVLLVDSFLDTVTNNPFNVTVPIGISRLENSSLVSLYPIPAEDKLYLKISPSFSVSSIEVYDTKGCKTTVNMIDNYISLRHFAKGIYSIKLNNDQQKEFVVKKFIVK